MIVGIWNANCVCMPNGLTDYRHPRRSEHARHPCDDGNPAYHERHVGRQLQLRGHEAMRPARPTSG